MSRPRRLKALLPLAAILLAACGGSAGVAGGGSAGGASHGEDEALTDMTPNACPDGEFYWSVPGCEPRAAIDVGEILSGGPPPDGIPPIDDPVFEDLAAGDEWLDARSPVLALAVNGDRRAYPLAILTWHEIVNDEVGGLPVVVTYCPLCNSALVFERTVEGAVLDFGTSGRLYRSNLVMYDRQTKNLWSQFTGKGVVGESYTGTQLERVPSTVLSWEEFKGGAPDGVVLSRETGHRRSYGENPYTGYDTEGSRPFLYRGPEDGRFDLMTRVVGLGAEEDPIAVPLAGLTAAGVVEVQIGDQQIAVVWAPGAASALDDRFIDLGKDVGQTAAFVAEHPDVGPLTFERPDEDGHFRDVETGTTWNLLGDAVEGPLLGSSLEKVPLDDTFWFVWYAFLPETRVAEGTP